MSFALLAPLGLGALAALVVPIVIHLVRRIELRTTEFAALRWISERVRPRRRIRFERPWLLLLRLLLLALLALLLARPVIDAASTANGARVVVAPGVDLGAARAAVSATADWRWLAPGFPPIEAPQPAAPVPIASLLRELDAELPQQASLVAIVPPELAGLDGERPQLSHRIDWQVVAGRMPAGAAGESGKSGKSVTIAVRYAPSAEPALKYLRSAVAALNARGDTRYALDAQALDVALSGETQELIWLGAELSPAAVAWIEAGGTAIVDRHAPRDAGAPVWRDAKGNALARVAPRGRGRLVTLADALAPSTFAPLLDADFPGRLLDLLHGPAPAPTRAPAETIRGARVAQASDANGPIPAATKPLDSWLALLIAALFLIERAVAARTREPA